MSRNCIFSRDVIVILVPTATLQVCNFSYYNGSRRNTTTDLIQILDHNLPPSSHDNKNEGGKKAQCLSRNTYMLLETMYYIVHRKIT